MLSVPQRWISSAAKRDLPSPSTKKSNAPTPDDPLVDAHVDPTTAAHNDESSDHRNNHNNQQKPLDKDNLPASPESDKGQLVDYCV